MSSKRTFSGAFGLVFLAAALWSGSAMAAGPTPAAIKADGLRWQAMADFYKRLQSPTPAGIKADGRRALQLLVEVCHCLPAQPVGLDPCGRRAALAGNGRLLQAAAEPDARRDQGRRAALAGNRAHVWRPHGDDAVPVVVRKRV